VTIILLAMRMATTKAVPALTVPLPHGVWTPESNPAVAELLDHLAEELAGEYVRLMEAAAKDQRSEKCQPDREGG